MPAALAELQSATAFYVATANAELGRAFVAEFERVANAALENPLLGPIFRGTRRRWLFRRFPYGIIYQAAPDELRIIAVAHHRRRPGYWARRR